MKKMYAIALAAVAMSFASCGNKTAGTAETDSLSVEQTIAALTEGSATETANSVIAKLQEQLQNADPEQVKTIAQAVADKVNELAAANDIEGLETYTALVSNFVAENAEKLQNNGIAATVSEAIATASGIPAGVVETAKSAATGVKTAALTSAITAIASGESVAEAVKSAATDAAVSAAADAAAQVAAGEEQAAAAKAAVDDAAAKAAAAAEAAKAAAKAAPDAAKGAAKSAASSAIDDAAASAKKKLGL